MVIEKLIRHKSPGIDQIPAELMKAGLKNSVIVIGTYHICQLRTKFYPTSCCQG